MKLIMTLNNKSRFISKAIAILAFILPLNAFSHQSVTLSQGIDPVPLFNSQSAIEVEELFLINSFTDKRYDITVIEDSPLRFKVRIIKNDNDSIYIHKEVWVNKTNCIIYLGETDSKSDKRYIRLYKSPASDKQSRISLPDLSPVPAMVIEFKNADNTDWAKVTFSVAGKDYIGWVNIMH